MTDEPYSPYDTVMLRALKAEAERDRLQGLNDVLMTKVMREHRRAVRAEAEVDWLLGLQHQPEEPK